MANTVSYNLELQTESARKALEQLYTRGNSLFASKGINIAVNSKGLTGFNRSLDQATSRILSFTATTALISKTKDALSTLATEAIQVQTAITGIQAILNATNSDLSKFQKSLFEIANKTGTSFFDAAAAAQEFSRAGLSLEKTLQATAAALGVVRTSGGNVTEVIQGLISTASAFEGQNFSFQEIADKFSALDAAFSTSASGIIQALSRVGSFASEAGVSLDQLGGLIAAVKQISGRSEGQIGNSIKSIFVNLQNENVQGAIEGVGVATKDANGEFRSAIDVLTDLSETYKTLTDSQKAFISQKVAGKFQANAFQSTIQALQNGTAQKGAGISAGADDNIAKRLALLNETTATTIQKFQNSITELSSTLGDAVGRNFVEGLLKYGNIALDGIKSIFEKGNPLGEAITSGLSAALTGPGIVVGATLLVKLFKTVVGDTINAGRQLLKNGSIIGGINSSLERQLAIQKEINKVLDIRNGTQASANGGGNLPPLVKPTRTTLGGSQFQSNPQALAADRAAAAARLRKERASYNQEKSRRALAAETEARNERVRIANIESAANKENKKRQFSKAVGAASFLVPAATSAISSQVDDKSTKRQIDAVGQGLSTALIGSFFGPVGTAAGVLVGGFQILSSVTKELYGNLDDVNEVVREQINENDKERQSGDLFVQSQRAYNEAVKTGTDAVIQKADRDLQVAQQNLGPSRSGLVALSGNIDKLIQENDRLNSVTDNQNSGIASKSVSTELVTKAYNGFFDAITGRFEKKIASSGDAQKLAKSISGGLDPAKASQDTINNFLEDFARTGDSSSLQEFTRDFIKDLDGATEAASNFSSNFQNGSEKLSVAILQEIQARQKSIKIAEIETQRRTQQQGFDKIFKDEISKAFTSKAFANKIQEIQRNNSLSSFTKRNEGLTGIAAIKADTAGQLLSAQNDFVSAIESAKTTFLPDLQEAILSNVQGEGTRGKIISAIKDTLGEGFNPATVKDILSKEIGADNTKRVFSTLGPSLNKFNEEVQLGAKVLEISNKKIQQEGERTLRNNRKFLGDPTQDQSKAISEIIAGKAAFNNGIPTKTDLLQRKKDPFSLSEDASAKSRLDLERLKLEGQTGIFSGDQAQRNGRARGDFSQLFNAARVQTDTGFASQAIKEFQSKNKDFGFGEGGIKTFSKTIIDAIKSGNFENLRKDPTFNSIRSEGASGSKSAADFTSVLAEAEQRFKDQNSAVETATQKFLNQNEIQTSIAQNTSNTADYTKNIYDILSQSPTSQATTVSNPSNFGQMFQNSGKIQELYSSLEDKQRALDTINQSSGANARTSFNDNLINFQNKSLAISPGKSIFKNVSNAQSELLPGVKDTGSIFGGIPSSLSQDTSFRGKNLSQDEIDKIIQAVNTGKTGVDLNNLIKQLFPQVTSAAGVNGQPRDITRGDEIIRGGVLDPLRKVDNKFNPAAQSNLQSEIQTINKSINDLKLQNSVLQNPQSTETAKIFENGVSVFTKAIDLFAQGANVAFNAQIGVDVTGAPEAGFQEKMKSGIRALFAELFEEATGKKPVLAPVAP